MGSAAPHTEARQGANNRTSQACDYPVLGRRMPKAVANMKLLPAALGANEAAMMSSSEDEPVLVRWGWFDIQIVAVMASVARLPASPPMADRTGSRIAPLLPLLPL